MGLFQLHHRWQRTTGWIISIGLLGMTGCTAPIQEYPIHYTTPGDQQQAIEEGKRASLEKEVDEDLEPAPVLVPPSFEEPPIVEVAPTPQPAVAPAPIETPRVGEVVIPEPVEPTPPTRMSELQPVAITAPVAPPVMKQPVPTQRPVVQTKPVHVEQSPSITNGDLYYVELGSYAHMLNADRLKRKVEQMGIPVRSLPLQVKGTNFTRVRAGPFPYRAEASWAARVLTKEGVETKLVKE
ncbi:SPOR domain-containing protein [Magnetococcus sp. PR-3]|uniref:SPOR domain-containing protein n=1 Tax=Magnetococcus sp. PR-3 TaxID=3120355 RepID=UPI002FCE240B